MEVACGEYGDMVPPLVVAVQNNHCALYQFQQKITNCDKSSVAAATLVDHNTLRHRFTNISENWHRSDIGSDIRETDILNDNDDGTDGVMDDVRTAAAAAAAASDSESTETRVALLHNSCRRAVPTLVLANGDISCDVTLLKEVGSNLSFSCSLEFLWTSFYYDTLVDAQWTRVAVLLIFCLTHNFEK